VSSEALRTPHVSVFGALGEGAGDEVKAVVDGGAGAGNVLSTDTKGEEVSSPSVLKANNGSSSENDCS
jgi:hypothetical protein